MSSEPMSDGPMLDAMDQFGLTVAALAGMRAQLVADGWADEEARLLLVAMWWKLAFPSDQTSSGDDA